MSDDLNPVWKKLDDHALEIVALKTRQAVDSNRIDSMEKNHSEMCRQLVLTEGKLIQSNNQTNTKLDALKSAYDKAEGARSAVKYIPNLLQAAITVISLYLMVRGLK